MTNDRVLDIQNELRRLANKQIAAHSQRFFKTGEGRYGQGDRFLGIRFPVLRKLARQYRGATIKEACQLLKSEFHEERLLALLLLVDMFKKANETLKRKKNS